MHTSTLATRLATHYRITVSFFPCSASIITCIIRFSAVVGGSVRALHDSSFGGLSIIRCPSASTLKPNISSTTKMLWHLTPCIMQATLSETIVDLDTADLDTTLLALLHLLVIQTNLTFHHRQSRRRLPLCRYSDPLILSNSTDVPGGGGTRKITTPGAGWPTLAPATG